MEKPYINLCKYNYENFNILYLKYTLFTLIL